MGNTAAAILLLPNAGSLLSLEGYLTYFGSQVIVFCVCKDELTQMVLLIETESS